MPGMLNHQFPSAPEQRSGVIAGNARRHMRRSGVSDLGRCPGRSLTLRFALLFGHASVHQLGALISVCPAASRFSAAAKPAMLDFLASTQGLPACLQWRLSW